eukprot:PhM_4_TR13092/c0_g1_i1/m.5707
MSETTNSTSSSGAALDAGEKAEQAVARALWDLKDYRKKYQNLDPVIRYTLLGDVQENLCKNLESWAEEVNRIYGVCRDVREDSAGFEQVGLFARRLQALLYSHDLIARNKLGFLMSRNGFKDWRVLAAFPKERADPLWMAKTQAEMWVPPNASLNQGGLVESLRKGRVYVVMPSKETMCCPLDVLQALFIDLAVVIVVIDPAVTSHSLIQMYKAVFHPFIATNFMRIVVTDDPKLRTRVLWDRSIDGCVLVGHTAARFNQIYFGSSSSAHLPNPHKFHISVLGGAPAWVIPPVTFSPLFLRGLARHLAVMKLRCGGQLHHSPQLLVTSSKWAQRERFTELLVEALRDIRTKEMIEGPILTSPDAYHRFDTFASSACKECVEVTKDVVLLRDTALSTPATLSEVRGPALAEICVPSGAVIPFLRECRDVLNNDGVLGSVACSMFAPMWVWYQHGYDINKWVLETNYGAFGFNTCASRALWIPQLRWGSSRGHKDSVYPVQGGSGHIGNMFYFDDATKSIVRSTFYNPRNPRGMRGILPIRTAQYCCMLSPKVRNVVPVLSAATIGL